MGIGKTHTLSLRSCKGRPYLVEREIGNEAKGEMKSPIYDSES